MKLHIKALIGFAALFIGAEAHAINCNNLIQFVNGNSYNTGSTVKNANTAFSCTVGGWCSIGGPYEPGVGWAWTNAWTSLGACDATASSSSKSSTASSIISSSSKSSVISSVVSSSKSSSSIASSSSSKSSAISSKSSASSSTSSLKSSASSSSSSKTISSSSVSSSSSSFVGGCAIQALPGGGYSMCKSDLDAAETSKTSAPIYALVKASIQTNDNSIVDAITPKAASNPDNVKRVESILSEADWNYLFPIANTSYDYTRFLRAIGKFKGLCATYTDGRDSTAICRKSLAAMFAHFTQETGAHAPNWTEAEWRQGLYFVRESGCTETGPGCGYNAECPTASWQTEIWPCGKQANGEYVKYYGRGAKQLSYHYNYGPFSQAMFGDAKVLLNNPDQVAESWLNLASAAFFFVYPQPPKPSMLHVIDGTWIPNAADNTAGIEPGFGATINVINGGLECNSGSEKPQAVNRIEYYKQFTNYLKVPIGTTEKLGCANMGTFTTAGAGAMLIYWDQDWSYNANNPGGGTFACKQVGYQTAYNALVKGDYQKCVTKYFDLRQIK